MVRYRQRIFTTCRTNTIFCRFCIWGLPVTIDTHSYAQLKNEIAERIVADRAILDQLRDEIRPLRSETRHIQPRTTYSLSLVAADGGNNSLRFDPFLIHLVRVVDSKNNEYVLEAITPSTNITRLSRQQFHDDGSPRTQLGEMMAYLDVTDLCKLSPMIRSNSPNRPVQFDMGQNLSRAGRMGNPLLQSEKTRLAR